jgi:hypothetical protein
MKEAVQWVTLAPAPAGNYSPRTMALQALLEDGRNIHTVQELLGHAV